MLKDALLTQSSQPFPKRHNHHQTNYFSVLKNAKESVSIDPTAPFKMYQVWFRAFKSPPI